MEENKMQWAELLQGAEGLQMLRRAERLRRLMGSQPSAEPPEGEPSVFEETKNERMLFAAIPFLDQEYQKDLYVIVRLMQMRRVLESGVLEARSRSGQSAFQRRRNMLAAIRPCLSEEEGRSLELVLKVMEVRQILQKKEEYDGIGMGKAGSTGAGRGTSAFAVGGPGEK